MKFALIQMNQLIGSLDDTFQKHCEIYEQHCDSVDAVVFPELSLTGYYPGDLLESKVFLRKQQEFADKLQKKTLGKRAAMFIGYAAQNPFSGKPLTNSVAVFENGIKIYEYAKRLLPTYNIFDESRHFEAGKSCGVFMFRGKKLGILICEDIWSASTKEQYAVDPVSELAKESPDLVISINASPSNVGKLSERYHVVCEASRKLRAPTVYLNQVGGHDEIVFDGASFSTDSNGKVVFRSKMFEEDVMLCSLTGSRLRFEGVSQSSNRLSDDELRFRQITYGLSQYVDKLGFSSVVVGCSGGIDSAVTLALATYALGPDRVKAVTMPSPLSSHGSVDDSAVLCQSLGIELFTARIADDYHHAQTRFTEAFGIEQSPLAVENMQARVRGRILMEYSNTTGALVLSTGNKSETSVGYFTLYGDSCGGLNLIGDLYKTEVYGLAKYINKVMRNVIPEEILTKPPSAELAPGQVDSQSLPDYDILDAILKLYIEGELLTVFDRSMAINALKNTSKEVISSVIRLVTKNEFKRRQTPPIIRVSKRSFGKGRQMPIAANMEYSFEL